MFFLAMILGMAPRIWAVPPVQLQDLPGAVALTTVYGDTLKSQLERATPSVTWNTVRRLLGVSTETSMHQACELLLRDPTLTHKIGAAWHVRSHLNFHHGSKHKISVSSIPVAPAGARRRHWLNQLARHLANLPIPTSLQILPYYPEGVYAFFEADFFDRNPTIVLTLADLHLPMSMATEHELFHAFQFQARHQNAPDAWPLHQFISGPENGTGASARYFLKHGSFSLEEIGAHMRDGLRPDCESRLPGALDFARTAVDFYDSAQSFIHGHPNRIQHTYSGSKIQFEPGTGIRLFYKADSRSDKNKLTKRELKRGRAWAQAYLEYLQ